MKIVHIYVPLLLLFATSCTTDFDIAADYQETTIVYGLLNNNDSIQYIKINKAFLDKNKGALLVAQDADSLYHQSVLAVVLEEWKNSVLINSYPLNKIDGSDDNLIKENGIFASSPNFLYKTTAPILENTDDDTYLYKLKISNTKNGQLVSAETPIVGRITNIRPSQSLPGNWASKSPYNIRWKSAENGKVYELRIIFNYTEKSKLTSIVDSLSLEWKIFSDIKSDDVEGKEAMSYQIESKNLFYFLNANLITDATVDREAISIDLIFYIGGETLNTFIEVTQANTGITQMQINPDYTNINNGMGIFSSRYDTTISNIPFSDAARDSFACGEITKHLNFVPVHPCQ